MTNASMVAPRCPNRPFLEQFSTVIEADYLLTGVVTSWQKGRLRILGHSPSTEVGIVLILYDIGTGESLWSVSGEEGGGHGLLASDPSFAAKKLFDKMLKKLPTFCRAT